MDSQRKSQLKRKVTPTKTEPVSKAVKVEIKEANKLNAMKKNDLVRYCQELLSEKNKLAEENTIISNLNKEQHKTIECLEKTVEELREKCSNTPVYLCTDCDYLAECVHDFNDHTHSPDDIENVEESHFTCYFCEETFETMSDVMFHTKLIHTSNVQHCTMFLEDNCNFGDQCWFLHSDTLRIAEPNIKCNHCEKKFKTNNALREHMKSKHIQMVKECKNEIQCKFGSRKCWFLHRENLEIAYQNAKNGNDGANMM